MTAFERALQLGETAGGIDVAFDASYGVMRLNWQRGAYGAAIAYVIKAIEFAERLGDDQKQIKALWGMYSLLFDAGDLRGARRAIASLATRIAPSDQKNTFFLHLNRGALELSEGR